MAIIEELGLQATIRVAGLPAPEFPSDEEPSPAEQFGPNTKHSHSYVQCTKNAEFSIKFEVTTPSKDIQQWLVNDDHAILFELDVDGGKMKSMHWVFRTPPSQIVHGVTDYVNGLLRKFRFTPISKVEDASEARIARDKELAKGLGQIRIRIWRVINTHQSTPASQYGSSPLTDQLAEKAFRGKAISHGTTLSDAVQVARCKNLAKFQRKDPEGEPLAVFDFKYRSTHDLQTMLIIPRPRRPSPPPDDGEPDLSNLSREEIERLARERLIEARGRKRSVKIEDNGEVPRASRPYKFIRIEGGKMAIDLTDDDDQQ